jgi:NAD-dependent dihydropyrimidine dehydrogenase PreA subunit
MPVTFDLSICDGCGKCDAICPGDVIYMHRPAWVDDGSGTPRQVNAARLDIGYHVDKKSPYLPKPEECWHCGSCRQDCPKQAITVVFPPDILCL